jgi:hypothetical protein
MRLLTSLTLFEMYFIPLLSFYLSLLPSCCWASAPPLIQARQFTHFFAAVASNNPAIPSLWPCSHARLQQLEEAMVHTRAMAQAAAAALNVDNAEFSASFCVWFGLGAAYIFALAAIC